MAKFNWNTFTSALDPRKYALWGIILVAIISFYRIGDIMLTLFALGFIIFFTALVVTYGGKVTPNRFIIYFGVLPLLTMLILPKIEPFLIQMGVGMYSALIIGMIISTTYLKIVFRELELKDALKIQIIYSVLLYFVILLLDNVISNIESVSIIGV